MREPPASVPGDQAMSLGAHLDNLRRHIMRGGKWFVLAFTVCFLAKDPITSLVTMPHRQTMEAIGQSAVLESLSYQETFIVQLKLAIFCGLFIGMPLLLRELWSFISVGLYPKEQQTVKVAAPLVIVSFVIGTAFGFFVMVPMGLRFLATYGDREIVAVRIRFSEYVNLFLMLTIALGFIFELPLIMWVLARVGIFTAAKYASVRRYAIVAAFIIGAVLTPPDVVTQLLMAGPLVVLYEVGILLTGGWQSTLDRGRFLIISISVIVLVAAFLVWDLYRVDRYLDDVGTPGNELVWSGGGDRPYEMTTEGVSSSLLGLARRSARPLALRAAADSRMVPLAAATAAEEAKDPMNLDYLRSIATDERGFVRDVVARALGAAGEPADSELLERLRTDRKDRSVQVSAAIALLERDAPSGGFTLIKTLENGPPGLAEQARAALVRARGADAGSVEAWWGWYHGSLAKSPLGDRRALVEILGELAQSPGASANLPESVYARLLEDADAYVRYRTAFLAPVELLLPLASDPDPTVRLAAGRRLVAARDYAGIPILIALIEDREAAVSRAAFEVLTKTTNMPIPERRETWEAWWRETAATFRFR